MVTESSERVPVPDHPFCEDLFLNIQPKPPLALLEAISSHPIIDSWGTEPDSHLAASSSLSGNCTEQEGSPLSLLSFRLNPLSYFSCFSQEECSTPFPCSIPISGHTLVPHCHSSSEGPSKLTSGLKMQASAVPSKGQQSLPWACGCTMADTSQVPLVFHHWAHIQPLSTSTCWSFPAMRFSVIPTPAWSTPWDCCHPQAGSALHLVDPHTTGLGPSIQPVPILLQSLPAQQINIPAQLSVICMHPSLQLTETTNLQFFIFKDTTKSQ